MKIGFFTNTYLPNIYGLTTSVEMFRKGLEELGHEVFVFAPKYHGYQDVNPRVIRYPSFSWRYKIRYAIPISFFPPMMRKIDPLHFDIIHVHQPFSVAKDGLRQGRRLGIPVVYTHHTRYEDYSHYVPLVPQDFLKKHVRWAATNFANQCDQVIAPSREIKDMIVSRGVTRPITVLPTGIDWQRYVTGDRDAVRLSHGIQRHETCLLWVGRMEKEKNIKFLLQAAREVLRQYPDSKLVLVGDGSEKAGIIDFIKQAELENRIILPGLVESDQIHHYYAAGDIFLQTSLSETQGMATTEALATGLTVVAVRATGTTDQIQDGVNGLLTDHDQQQFVAKVRTLLENDSLRKTLGAKARELAREMDYRKKAKELEELYLRVLEKSNG